MRSNLEAELQNRQSTNAMRLSSNQLREALARLSPAAKVIAKAQAATDQERKRIDKHSSGSKHLADICSLQPMDGGECWIPLSIMPLD